MRVCACVCMCECVWVCVCVCAVSSCGMLSRQEELSGTSGTNQRRRAQGHEGSERKLKKGKLDEGRKGEKKGECEEESGM